MDRIGFVGLGRMGKGMASNLQKKGFALTVFDLQEAPLLDLEKLGAKRAGILCRTGAELRHRADRAAGLAGG